MKRVNLNALREITKLGWGNECLIQKTVVEMIVGELEELRANCPAADESAKPVDVDELVRKAKLFDEAVEKKVTPPIFWNGETKRDPVLREALEQDGRKQHCKPHDFRPYYEGVEVCSYCKTVQSGPTPVASKEAVTLSDAQDAVRYRRMRAIYRESGRIDAARESDAAYDARIDDAIAQRDASEAEGK
jgi:hypothetical protein